ncbi:hypothetical protein FA95DRAFT_1673797 [Auriscalpium vulgare]|uniref:Uncharacterized protein n=1 Tax=Auriscalpium vulgare TaxID=40419 RepID=A0ACB8SDF3_9AGAM|nr:hypothetical protein FA95DRAFT_1673797 [Auriscalpium vulgare]
MEEAAAIAAEYIASLDNLPAEVAHLLAEIKHKETKSQEVLQEIQKESAKYIRHSLRNGTAPMSSKDEQIPQKVNEGYAEVDRLAEQKIRLSQRLVDLISRARARLDYDLSKVLVLQGDLDPSQQGSFVSTTRNPVQQINESLRSAMALSDALPVPSAPTTPTPSAPLQKRRRVAAVQSNASIKLPSPAPVSAPPQRTRVTTQSHRPSPAPRRGGRVVSIGPDEDAEGEDDLEEMGGDDDDTEDKSLYCFCQKLSYGEMIACDNADCAYQWVSQLAALVRQPGAASFCPSSPVSLLG